MVCFEQDRPILLLLYQNGKLYHHFRFFSDGKEVKGKNLLLLANKDINMRKRHDSRYRLLIKQKITSEDSYMKYESRYLDHFRLTVEFQCLYAIDYDAIARVHVLPKVRLNIDTHSRD